MADSISKELADKVFEAIEVAIIMHLPLLAKEKGIACATVGNKGELGAAAGLEVGTSSVAIIQPGDATKLLKQISEGLGKK